MRLGLYTSTRYLQHKLQAVHEAIERLHLDAEIVHDSTLERPSSNQQAFGFEELVQRARHYAMAAVTREDVDIGIGVENALAFIYTANEWYYVICVALAKKDGSVTASFTPGISVPDWMIKEVQESRIKIEFLTQKLAGEDDPVAFFSGRALTRKDLMAPALILAFAKFNLEGEVNNARAKAAAKTAAAAPSPTAIPSATPASSATSVPAVTPPIPAPPPHPTHPPQEKSAG